MPTLTLFEQILQAYIDDEVKKQVEEQLKDKICITREEAAILSDGKSLIEKIRRGGWDYVTDDSLNNLFTDNIDQFRIVNTSRGRELQIK